MKVEKGTENIRGIARHNIGIQINYSKNMGT